MSEEKKLDIVQALSSQRNRDLFRNDWRGKIVRRALIGGLFFKGDLGAVEAFRGLLPWRAPLSNDFDYSSLIVRHFLKDKNYAFNPVNFLGYELNYLPTDFTGDDEQAKAFCVAADMVAQIVSSDQYCAREFIKENATIIDVGANIGIFSLFAHYLSRSGNVYAFEPTPKIFAILKRNVNANNLAQNVHIINKALGDKDKKIMLLRSADALESGNRIVDSNFVIGGKGGVVDFEEASMMTLDKFIQENDIKKVDFIKIDAEGYEKQIIEGAKEAIKRFSPVIACSAYHLKNDEVEIPKLVLSLNNKYDYRFERRREKDLIFWPKNNYG